MTVENQLGAYLKARRTKLDPTALGFAPGRRRTPGLRREEVALRANLSTTWYTWLEQGRGGAPSAEVLERIAQALLLTEQEREHIFLLAFGHPPAVREHASEGITPRIQRILDALTYCPSIVRTSDWDVVGWNQAAAALFGYYGTLPPDQRNILRRMFGSVDVQAAQSDWANVARYVVASFRAESARTGKDVSAFVEELSNLNPLFKELWQENDVRSHGEGTKHLKHPLVGELALEYSSFSIEGRPDLAMVVYNPATEEDREKVVKLLASNVAPASVPAQAPVSTLAQKAEPLST